jgi:hypothetical protein
LNFQQNSKNKKSKKRSKSNTSSSSSSSSSSSNSSGSDSRGKKSRLENSRKPEIDRSKCMTNGELRELQRNKLIAHKVENSKTTSSRMAVRGGDDDNFRNFQQRSAKNANSDWRRPKFDNNLGWQDGRKY